MYKFTVRAKKALEIGSDLAKELGHKYIGTEHILYGLIKEGEGVASKVLNSKKVFAEDVKNKIIEILGKDEIMEDTKGFTPSSKKILETSFVEARKLKYNYIGTEHILIGILKDEENIAVKILLDLNIGVSSIYSKILEVIKEGEEIKDKINESVNDLENNDINRLGESKKNKEKNSFKDTPTLNQYGVDLTKKALEGKLDPIIGRSYELERVIQILSRRGKNNPCLIGEPRSWKNRNNRRISTKNKR